jgi:hypothetical protein
MGVIILIRVRHQILSRTTNFMKLNAYILRFVSIACMEFRTYLSCNSDTSHISAHMLCIR